MFQKFLICPSFFRCSRPLWNKSYVRKRRQRRGRYRQTTRWICKKAPNSTENDVVSTISSSTMRYCFFVCRNFSGRSLRLYVWMWNAISVEWCDQMSLPKVSLIWEYSRTMPDECTKISYIYRNEGFSFVNEQRVRNVAKHWVTLRFVECC